MTRGSWILACGLAGASAAFPLIAVWAQSPAGQPGRADRSQLQRPVYKVAQVPAENTASNQPAANPAAGNQAPAQAQDHPLVPALKIAYTAMENFRPIKDYSCRLVKRERISGKLGEPEYMFLKVRHEPFSVYMYFLGPERIKGQEAIYVAGKNDGNLLGHGVGIKKIAGTVSLKPNSAMAMAGQRYPITEIGILNLTKRLIEVAENDKNYGECDVKFFNGAKIRSSPDPNVAPRVCTCIQVTHPQPRKNFLFNVARVYVDDEYKLPIRYEAYEWPTTPGDQPQLLEEYTYLDLKFNNGFTDADFDDRNPNYGFH